MPVHGIILDIDGMLVYTNPSQVEAWRRAFQQFGYNVPRERIEIGTNLPRLADVLVTKEEAEASKPEPDREVCRAAGVVFLASSPAHTAHLHTDLDNALELASSVAASCR